MKKQIITHLCGLFCATAIINTTNAQTTAMLPSNVFDAKQNLEYILTNPESAASTSNALAISDVSPKAVKSFDKSYKGINDTKWYRIDKNTYLATFTSKDGRSSRAAVAKNGYIYYAIHTGNEQNLPKSDRHLIKSNYVDYNIGAVNEVKVDNHTVWVVNLQDADNLVIARSADNSLDELAHYQTHFNNTRKGRVIIPH